MNIAWLTPYVPWPPDTGGKSRTYHLLERLAARHAVDLVSVHYGPRPAVPPQLAALCGDVRLLPIVRHWGPLQLAWQLAASRLPFSVEHFVAPERLADEQARLAGGEYDLLLVDEPSMAPYVLGLPGDTPRVLMRQKVDHVHYAGVAARRPWGRQKVRDTVEAAKLRRYEQVLSAERFDAWVVCSALDQAAFAHAAPDAAYWIVPNGVDDRHFAPGAGAGRDDPDRPPTIMYMGTMGYYPNVDAALWFADEVFGSIRSVVPDARWVVVGHEPPPEVRRLGRDPAVEITGSVPDVRPFLAACDVFVCPLRLGSGTRLKIVEAMAFGRPVVSTSVGAEGLDVTDGQNALIADTPAAFAAATVRVLRDPDLAARLVAGGAELARARYSWRTLGDELADRCEALVARGRAGKAG